MKKSLIVLAAFVMSLALVSIAFAEVECVYTPTKGVVGPKCVVVPAKTVVSQPGTPFAKIPTTVMVPEARKASVFTPVCQGKGKGWCPVGCNDKIKWTAKWATLVQCGEYTYTVKVPKPAEKVQPLACKVVPLPPCSFPW